MPPRSSAEVVNATLLEVFLAFVFVVLSIAWFEHGEGQVLQRKAQSDSAVIDSLRRALRSSQDTQDVLRAELDTVRAKLFHSPFPPTCNQAARPADFITVTLSGPGTLDILVNRGELRYARGQRISLSLSEFPLFFADVWRYSRSQGCRFRARVNDTEDLPKADFKRSLAAVQSIFYTAGELR